MTIYKIIIKKQKGVQPINTFEYKTAKEYFKNLETFLRFCFEIEGKTYFQSFTSHMTIKEDKYFKLPREEITTIFVD